MRKLTDTKETLLRQNSRFASDYYCLQIKAGLCIAGGEIKHGSTIFMGPDVGPDVRQVYRVPVCFKTTRRLIAFLKEFDRTSQLAHNEWY